MSILFGQLRRRGLIAAVTTSALEARCETPLALYCGFDPTAPSLHVGNLLAVVTLMRFRAMGHRVVALIGGATGLIGDPSGRATERPQQEQAAVAANAARIERQLASIFARQRAGAQHGLGALAFVNNADIYRATSVLDFVSSVGRHARVSAMLGRESVRARMETEAGISFAEFTYQLFQAYDFYHLHKHEGCVLQLGGSDQWGNITAGIDLIHRLSGAEAFGMTLPLVVDKAGNKFGKSAGNAVWLAPDMTKPFDLYQYFVRAEDDEVETLLRYFTFLPLGEINELMQRQTDEPGSRTAQKALAEHVTGIVHGDDEARRAADAAEAMYGRAGGGEGDRDKWAEGLLGAGVPFVTAERAKVLSATYIELAVLAGVAPSKTVAKRIVAAGGLYLNNSATALSAAEAAVRVDEAALLLGGTALVLRAGKRTYGVIKLHG